MILVTQTMRQVAVVAMVGILAACCPGKSDEQRQAEAAATASKMAEASGAKITFTPEALSECDLKKNPRQAIQVSWDATASNASTVKVLVRGPRDNDKVWTSGGATGSETTGQWVVVGTTFTLKDGDDKPLAQATVASKACTQ